MNKDKLTLIHEAARISGWYKRTDGNVLKRAYNAITDELTAEVVEAAISEPKEIDMKKTLSKPTKKATKKKGK